MKKLSCLILAILLVAATFVGCGEKKTNSKFVENRVLFNKVNLKDYVELGDYKGIPVDKKSDTFKEYYDEIVKSDATTKGYYLQKTEGKVAYGDTVNIDYVGKIDGIAFQGGTASGSELLIGSKTFISGFEDGLIDKEIGSTVVLNLKFPDDYHSADVAGKPVEFTVKINYVKTEDPQSPEQFFDKLGYKTLEEYEKDVTKSAIENYLVDTVIANSKFKSYPADDIEMIYEKTKNILDLNIQSQYGMGIEQYWEYTNQTEDKFKQDAIKNNIQPLLKTQMVMYSIFEQEGFDYEVDGVDDKIAELIKETGDTTVKAKELKDYYGAYYFENIYISDIIVDFLYENAKIS